MLPQHGGQPGRVSGGVPKQQGQPATLLALDGMMSASGSFPVASSMASSSQQSEMKPQDYGLMGILPIIRAPTKESGPLAFGLELTSLFPTISSPEPVHAAFAGPWAAGPIKREPDYQIPQAYLVSPPPKITDKIDMFSDETLFYIFYTMPKDAMQVSAARALAKRDWMYHKELKLWFKRVETMKGPNSETGSFLCMDISRWEEVRKDGITLEYEKLERNY